MWSHWIEMWDARRPEEGKAALVLLGDYRVLVARYGVATGFVVDGGRVDPVAWMDAPGWVLQQGQDTPPGH